MGWERAAPRYDECWTDTRLFVEPLLDAAGVQAGTRLLDVACGPGYVSEAAAVRGAEPLGLDVAEAMIELARVDASLTLSSLSATRSGSHSRSARSMP
jgi:2-polyprenyl-3-methyl-5-hydroxy-6-metoxy-1,4-benzoquinol methylase